MTRAITWFIETYAFDYDEAMRVLAPVWDEWDA